MHKSNSVSFKKAKNEYKRTPLYAVFLSANLQYAIEKHPYLCIEPILKFIEMQIWYMQDKFFVPHLSHITRSVCKLKQKNNIVCIYAHYDLYKIKIHTFVCRYIFSYLSPCWGWFIHRLAFMRVYKASIFVCGQQCAFICVSRARFQSKTVIEAKSLLLAGRMWPAGRMLPPSDI